MITTRNMPCTVLGAFMLTAKSLLGRGLLELVGHVTRRRLWVAQSLRCVQSAFHTPSLRAYVTNGRRDALHDTSIRHLKIYASSMDPYQQSFIGLVALNTGLAYKQYRQQKSTTVRAISTRTQGGEKIDHAAIRHFEKNFYLVYCIAVAADWMQGPHIYALYKYEKGLRETTVAALYASGFISGAISASFVGSLADKHGRRAACLVYCLTYSMCCLTMLSDEIIILVLGRILGGISTTLLFSVFETWMIADYHSRGIEMAGLDLGNVFGRMTTLGSIVAILCGVVGDMLVQATGSRTMPFLASVCCLCVAAALLLTRGKENYGEVVTSTSTSDNGSIPRNLQMLALAATSCIFEGTMYLFIFFWSASLKSARLHADPPNKKDPPFGLIFSCFMCAMMFGSQMFTRSLSKTSTSASMSSVILVASASLLTTLLASREMVIFAAFCVFEAAIGIYFPSMGSLKGRLIADGIRAKAYGLLRLPLNIFVVVGHSLAEDGTTRSVLI